MPKLEIQVLGAPGVFLDSQPVKELRRKALALLAYLVIEATPVRREVLAAFLWPDYDSEPAFAYLRRALWELNDSLGKQWLVADRETISFALSEDVRLDVAEYQQYVESCSSDDFSSDCLVQLEQAVKLYRGDFLAGFSLPDSTSFDEWQFFKSEELRRIQAGTLEKLSIGYERRDDLENSLVFARRWLELDLLNEAAHRALMNLYTKMGQRSSALKQYELCKQILREQLNVAPQPETKALFEAIRQGDVQRISSPTTPDVTESVGMAVSFSNKRILNLPQEVTPFVGRTEEINEILQLLLDSDSRLVTLVGPGGIGKTRLAIRTGNQIAELQGLFPDGICFVPLAGLNDVSNISANMAAILNLTRIDESGEPMQQILDFLEFRNLLVIMDNFEHLVNERSIQLVTDLISTASGVKLLVTSRVPLNIQGEQLYPVRGMRLPNGKHGRYSLAELQEFSAVALFIQAARRVHPQFEPTDDNILAIIQVCRMVQGTPLAIEMSATWVRLLSVHEIEHELQQGLDFLETTQHDVPERQRSIRAVFNASWRLLAESEQRVFKKLSIFTGGFTREAAQQITGATLQDLASLANNSMLQRDIDGRYELHELLRQYAAELLLDDPQEMFDLRDRHSVYYMDLLNKIGRSIRGNEQRTALQTIDRSADNIRAAWQWAVMSEEYARLDKALLGLLVYLNWRLWTGGFDFYLDSAIQALESKAENTDFEKLLLAKLLVLRSGSYMDWTTTRPAKFNRRAYELIQEVGAGEELGLWYAIIIEAYGWRVEPVDAIQMLFNSLAYLREHGDGWEIAYVLRSLGYLLVQTGKVSQAVPLANEAAEISRSIGDSLSLAYTLNLLGNIASRMQEYEQAEQHFEESRQVFFSLGMTNLGIEEIAANYAAQGKFQQAFQVYEEVRKQMSELGDRTLATNYMSWESIYLLRAGEYAEARRVREECIRLSQETNDLTAKVWNAFEMGEIERVSGNFAAARKMYEQSTFFFGDNRFFSLLPFYHRGLGEIALVEGDLAAARDHFETSLELSIQSFHFWNQTYVLSCLARVEIAAGQTEQAHAHLKAALETAATAGDRTLYSIPLTGFARFYAARGDHYRAAALAGFVLSFPASWQEYKDQSEEILTQLGDYLSAEELSAAQKETQDRELDQIVKEEM